MQTRIARTPLFFPATFLPFFSALEDEGGLPLLFFDATLAQRERGTFPWPASASESGVPPFFRFAV